METITERKFEKPTKYYDHTVSVDGDFFVECDDNGYVSEYAIPFRSTDIDNALKIVANNYLYSPHYGTAGNQTYYKPVRIDEKTGYVMRQSDESRRYPDKKLYVKWFAVADHYKIKNQMKNVNSDYLAIMQNAIDKTDIVRISKRTGMIMFNINFPKYFTGKSGDRIYVSSENNYLSSDPEIAEFQMKYAGLV